MEPPPSHSEAPPLRSLTQRYKTIWRVLLISNLALGAYMFAKAKKKNVSIENAKIAKTGVEESKAAEEVPSVPAPIPEEPAIPTVVTRPVKVQEPIPEDQQIELFRWILEEKRKIKPKDSGEKKLIDKEKAMLKQYICAKSIPKL